VFGFQSAIEKGKSTILLLLPQVHGLSGIEWNGGFKQNQGSIHTNQRGGDQVSGKNCFFLALLLALASMAAAKDVAVIANKGNAMTGVTMPELVKVCKGQTSRWPDGKPVTFITRNPASLEMKLVLDKVYGMSKEEVAATIAAANHGRTNHPAILVVESDEELVNKVQSIPGAIGLVDVYSINGGVTVVRLGGKLPLEPGYALHGN
jgi:hypothetical protein